MAHPKGPMLPEPYKGKVRGAKWAITWAAD